MSTVRPRNRRELEAGIRAEAARILTAAVSVQSAAQQWLELVNAHCKSESASIYRVSAAGRFELLATTRPNVAGLGAAENSLSPHTERRLRGVLTDGGPQFMPAKPRLSEESAASSSSLYFPMLFDGLAPGVIELVFERDVPVEEWRGAVVALTAAADCLAGYERGVQRREEDARRKVAGDLDRFVRQVHEKLNVRHTAYVTANDGRRLIGCDRATVLLRRGRQYVAESVSGVDEIETRSRAAKLLGRLAEVTAATEETLVFDGSVEDLTPQVREVLNEYLDETAVRSVMIFPLRAKNPAESERNAPSGKPSTCPPLGVLVVEQIDDVAAKPGRRERIALVADHATVALSKALQYEAIPFLPLWRSLGSLKGLVAPGTRWKTAVISFALFCTVAALCFVQADFAIHSRGELQPIRRRNVFAPSDGTVKSIEVRHGQRVAAGQPLLVLRNTDLDVSIADVSGQRTSTHEQLLATERSLFDRDSELSLQERHRLVGRRSELKQRLTAQDEQLQLLQQKRESLRIVSPIDGEVSTWNIEQLLQNRPVRQGQALLDVADTAGPWELELQVPEDGIACLLSEQEKTGPRLPVSYRLAAEPSIDRSAQVREVHYAAEIRGDEGNTVLVRAELGGESLPSLRPGAEASAKVYCGRCAIGYVWLHDAVDFLRMKVLFRLY